MRTTIATTITTAALKRKFNHNVLINILNAVNESMGKGLEYNLNLIDDPGATLAKITSRTRLTYPQTRRYLQLLADQGLVSIGIYRRKRRTRKKGREIKRRLTVTTVKITDKGYKYLVEEKGE